MTSPEKYQSKSDSTQKTIEIAILASPDTTPSTVYGMNDMLYSAGRDWSFLTEGVLGTPLIKPTIVSSATGEILTVNNGVLKAERQLDNDYHPDAICVLELFLDPYADITERYANETKWLKQYWDKGGVIATACTGALLLAETGLLDGLDATTHWGFCDSMSQRYPKITIKANRTFITTGDQERLVLAGGGASWMDLGLYLIAKFVCSEEAIKVSKLHLIEWHDSGQQPYAFLCKSRQYDDALISEAQVWLANNYDTPSPVNAVTQNSGIPERSFARRFKSATGMTPIEYVLNLRIEEAKHMLEIEAESVESVAEKVGYQDASFFSRKFQKKVGLTPSQYRKKFSRLRAFLR